MSTWWIFSSGTYSNIIFTGNCNVEPKTRQTLIVRFSAKSPSRVRNSSRRWRGLDPSSFRLGNSTASGLISRRITAGELPLTFRSIPDTQNNDVPLLRIFNSSMCFQLNIWQE